MISLEKLCSTMMQILKWSNLTTIKHEKLKKAGAVDE